MEGKSRSLYIPPEQAETVREAQGAWARFWDFGCVIATLNRQRLERGGKRTKSRAAGGKRANRRRARD